MSLSALNLLGICLVDRAARESGSSCLFLLVDCSAASWEENDDRNTWIPYRYPLCFFWKNESSDVHSIDAVVLEWIWHHTLVPLQVCAFDTCSVYIFLLHPKSVSISYMEWVLKKQFCKKQTKKTHICRQIFPKCVILAMVQPTTSTWPQSTPGQ